MKTTSKAVLYVSGYLLEASESLHPCEPYVMRFQTITSIPQTSTLMYEISLRELRRDSLGGLIEALEPAPPTLSLA